MEKRVQVEKEEEGKRDGEACAGHGEEGMGWRRSS
jgi:hypothetical protein